MEPDLPQRVVNFIVRYQTMHAFSPSVEDIATGCTMSRSEVRATLDALEFAGRITCVRASIAVHPATEQPAKAIFPQPEYTASDYAAVLAVWEAIGQTLKAEQRSPSVEEIANTTGLELPAVRSHVTQLVRSGNLKREKGQYTLLVRPVRPPGPAHAAPRQETYVASKVMANDGQRYFE